MFPHMLIRLVIYTYSHIDVLDTFSVEIDGIGNCFITFKDHKEILVNLPTIRLIDHTKNENGGISKSLLDKMNISLCERLKLNKWKTTTAVINWFQNID